MTLTSPATRGFIGHWPSSASIFGGQPWLPTPGSMWQRAPSVPMGKPLIVRFLVSCTLCLFLIAHGPTSLSTLSLVCHHLRVVQWSLLSSTDSPNPLRKLCMASGFWLPACTVGLALFQGLANPGERVRRVFGCLNHRWRNLTRGWKGTGRGSDKTEAWSQAVPHCLECNPIHAQLHHTGKHWDTPPTQCRVLQSKVLLFFITTLLKWGWVICVLATFLGCRI